MGRKLRIAVEGCCHGELEKIYEHLQAISATGGHTHPVDLLIICGDFQAIRNLSDLQCMAVPAKFKQIGDFHRYYAGDKVAPVPTIVVGGNHEASNYFQELPYGGYIAPNIYYLGYSNVITFAGLRIASLSGIWGGPRDYVRGYYERPPYDSKALRTVYHVRHFQVKKLSYLRHSRIGRPLDIFVSHDWPRGVVPHGDKETLLRRKPFFRAEVERNELGSPACEELLSQLRPRRWFSAHLHVKFEAVIEHPPQTPATKKRPRSSENGQALGREEQVLKHSAPSAVSNPDEIALELEDDEVGIDTKPGSAQVHNPEELDIALSEEEEHDDFNQGESKQEQMAAPAEELSLEDYKRQVLSRHNLLPIQTSIDDLIDKTQFLALDKCLPRRQFLEILEIESNVEDDRDLLKYDSEWLAITKAFAPFMSTTSYQKQLPGEMEMDEAVAHAKSFVDDRFGDLSIPESFEKTAPCQSKDISQRTPVRLLENPQTNSFCERLGIDIPFR